MSVGDGDFEETLQSVIVIPLTKTGNSGKRTIVSEEVLCFTHWVWRGLKMSCMTDRQLKIQIGIQNKGLN